MATNVITDTLNLNKAPDILGMFGISGTNLLQFFIRLIVCGIVFFLGCKLIDFLTGRLLKRIATGKGVDISTMLYASSIIRFGSRLILVIILIGFLGVKSNTITGVFTAISAGLALASQDIVKDFIGGLSLMLTKPFAVDDYIVFPGTTLEGFVKTIAMFHVILRGRGDRTITIPSGKVFRYEVTNLTAEGNWLMELKVGITYEDSIKVAREVMLEEARKEPLVMQERPAEVILSELGESSINLILLAWTTKADHFVAYWRLLENIKLALEANGVTIAYNQLDVHLGKLDERGEAAELAEKRWESRKDAQPEILAAEES